MRVESIYNEIKAAVEYVREKGWEICARKTIRPGAMQCCPLAAVAIQRDLWNKQNADTLLEEVGALLEMDQTAVDYFVMGVDSSHLSVVNTTHPFYRLGSRCAKATHSFYRLGSRCAKEFINK